MKENNTKPLKLALHAMDSRAIKTMMLFLRGPCKGAAIVVNAVEDADVDIFDADAIASKKLLENHLQENMLRPVIVLSLQDVVQEGVLHVKKPVKMGDMLLVLDQSKTLAGELSKKTAELEKPSTPGTVEKDFVDLFNYELFDHISSSSWDEPAQQTVAEEPGQPMDEPEKQEPRTLDIDQDDHNKTYGSQTVAPTHPASAPQTVAEEPGQQVDGTEKQDLKTYVIDQERNKTSKHQTAMRLDEKGFHDYIGTIEDINLNDPEQFINAHYNPKEFFQGYFQSALVVCRAKNQSLLLQSHWCPITLFPRTQEVWLDARDSELNAFAGIKLKYKTMASKIAITPIDPETMNLGGALDKFQSMDAFLWKLACWTSKGRYPQAIDYRLPVFLTSWPNFTRLLITPHALRIAALLIQGPRTMVNVAQTLNIKPHYVFVFISAAYAVGLAGQVKRVADSLVQPPDAKPSKGQGLLGRIMSKLRDNKT